MMRRHSFYIALIFLMLAGCGKNKPQPPAFGDIPAVDSLVAKQLSQNQFAGAVIRVQQGDSILHRTAYGYARQYDMRLNEINHPEKMTTETMFDLASLTKVCATTFGIMILVDQDKIQLDDPIYKWLPEFEAGKKKQITIRHLLTHSAGLYQWKPTYYFASNGKEQYNYIAGLPLKWEVGAGRHYSDLGFILLGDIIERVSGEPLDEFLAVHLYQPMKMNRTTFNPLQKGFKNIAATSHGNPFEHRMVYDDSFGYDVDVDPKSWDGWRNYTVQGEVSDGNAWYTTLGVSGHAGLFSTADDLQKLVNLLINKGRYEGKEIITPDVIDTFLTKNKYGNGLGWAMDPDVIHTLGAPDGAFGHTGFTGTSIVVVPKYKLSVIILTNREQAGLQPDGYYPSLSSFRQNIFSAVLDQLNK